MTEKEKAPPGAQSPGGAFSAWIFSNHETPKQPCGYRASVMRQQQQQQQHALMDWATISALWYVKFENIEIFLIYFLPSNSLPNEKAFPDFTPERLFRWVAILPPKNLTQSILRIHQTTATTHAVFEEVQMLSGMACRVVGLAGDSLRILEQAARREVQMNVQLPNFFSGLFECDQLDLPGTDIPNCDFIKLFALHRFMQSNQKGNCQDTHCKTFRKKIDRF